MEAEATDLSRISKLLLDRDQMPLEEALARRQQFNLTLVCGADVQHSYVLQLAVLTAASIGVRCFPGAVQVALPPSLRDAQLRIWPTLGWTFQKALADILGPGKLLDLASDNIGGPALAFGDVPVSKKTLRVTFDGWVAKVGPSTNVPRLPEREYCSLAGVLAGALAMTEEFFSFAQINIEAGHRTVALSLWRPDMDASNTAALGVPVEHLPRELWVLGLGHLGNGYLWALGTLPYSNPCEVEFALMDYDKIEKENAETGLIFQQNDRRYKTRACSEWLESRKFGTKLVERRFDATFRRHSKEAALALCGFDSIPSRRDLETADFSRVVETGLGGTMNNFDTINLHTLPHPRPLKELWPDLSPEEQQRQHLHQEEIAKTNKAYTRIPGNECGRYELAGKSVAVPFVGAAAGALVAAEVLRIAHDGVRFTDLKIRLGAVQNRTFQSRGIYGVNDLNELTFSRARLLENEK